MWVKIPVKTSNDQNEQNDLNVNTAIYQAFKLKRFFDEANLEQKSAKAKSEACRRKLKSLQQQVLKNYFNELVNYQSCFRDTRFFAIHFIKIF